MWHIPLTSLLQVTISDPTHLRSPFCCLSPVAFVEMLTKWGGDIPRQMGMSNERHRRASKDKVQGLLQGLCETFGGLEVPIELEREWQVTWPRPPTPWKVETLRIDSAGLCDIESWIGFASSRHTSKRGDWRQEDRLIRLAGSLKSVAVWDFFEFVCFSKGFKTLHKQLLWTLGMRLQSALCLVAEGKREGKGIGMKEVKFSQIMEQPHVMDRKLLEYITAAELYAKGLVSKCISLATDKASVCGLGVGLQSTMSS